MDSLERNRFYNRSAWKKLRASKLSQNPLCEECLKRELFVPAVHVDHVLPLATHPERGMDATNLQSLCHSCHSGKTREEQTGRKSKHWSSGRVGLDGIPLDPNHKWNRERNE
jgi:5-methylcytosine-specific restriction enzyme A